MGKEDTKKRLEELSKLGNDPARYLLAMINRASPGMQKIFLEQAETALNFVDAVEKNSKDEQFLKELNARNEKRG